MSCSKTPVSLLQEVGAKRGITPTYELLSNQGPTHEPMYIYKCIAGEWTAEAQGTSKKKAKHYVALLVLIKMVKSSMENPNEANNLFISEVKNSASGLLGRDDAFQIISSNISLSLEDVVDHLDESVENANANGPMSCPVNEEELGNPIGSLQELCQKNMWPQPSYDFKINQHHHETTCIVKLWKWTVEAIGKSRKLSKRKAALNMLDKLKIENLSIPRDMLIMMEEGTLKLENDGPSIEPSKVCGVAQSVQRAYARNLKGIFTNKGVSVNIHSNNCNDTNSECQTKDNSTEIIEEVCKKYDLTALYTYIYGKTKDTIYCLVQLDTDPVHVVRGKGMNLNEARNNAASRLMLFIDHMSCPPIMRDID